MATRLTNEMRAKAIDAAVRNTALTPVTLPLEVNKLLGITA